MNNNMEHKKQFEALLALLLDNKLADHEFDALIALAEHNPELKNQLSEQLTIDNLIRQRFEATDQLDNFVNQTVTTAFENKTNKRFESDIISAITNNQFDKRPADDNIVRGYFPWLLTALSTAACALLSFHFLTAEPNHDKSNHAEATQLTTQLSEPTEHKAKPQYEYQDLGVAVIANAIGLHENAIFKIGDSVKPGQLHLSEGFLELEFYRGAQLKISGPAAINIINEERVELISGKVMTDVPKVAIGFTIDTPNSEIIDLGTEIGVEVTKDGLSQVHVFEGLVEVRNDLGYQQLIEKGQAINFSGETRSEWRDDIASKAKFAEFNTIDDLTGTAISQQHQKWLSVKAEVLADSNLVTYYDFEPSAKKPRILTNLSSHGDKHHGAIVGARWSQGPWQGKHALKFKRASDRVRVDIEEKLTSFTMATWVKIDSLDRRYNSLLLTDGYKPGDIHWQISNYRAQGINAGIGTIVLGLFSRELGPKNYTYEPFFSVSDSGTWYHLATRVDSELKTVSLFVNGEKVKQTKLMKPSDYWLIGPASIGNWDPKRLQKPLRNLNGSIAEIMIFSQALDDNYIKRLALID